MYLSHVCMYMSAAMYVCMYVCMYVSLYVPVGRHVCMYVSVTCMYLSHVCMYMSADMYVCMYVCIFICTCRQTCMCVSVVMCGGDSCRQRQIEKVRPNSRLVLYFWTKVTSLYSDFIIGTSFKILVLQQNRNRPYDGMRNKCPMYPLKKMYLCNL